MRKSVLILFILTVILTVPVLAQDAPKVELFGGYQYTNVDAVGFDRFSFNGWNASATYFFNKHVGLTAEFAGAYKNPNITIIDPLKYNSTVKMNSYMVGPTYRIPMKRVTPYAHALIGWTTVQLPTSQLIRDYYNLMTDGEQLTGLNAPNLSYNPLSFAVGGGADVKLTKRLSLRAAQVDYYATKLKITDSVAISGESLDLPNIKGVQSHVRIATGIVYKF